MSQPANIRARLAKDLQRRASRVPREVKERSQEIPAPATEDNGIRALRRVLVR